MSNNNNTEEELVTREAPQILVIFHNGNDEDLYEMHGDKEAILTSQNNLTIIDFRSGLIYRINGEEYDIKSYRSSLPQISQQPQPNPFFMFGGVPDEAPDYVT